MGGTYYQPAMQEPGHMEKIEPGWALFCDAFAEHLPTLAERGVDSNGFGMQMAEAAPRVAELMYDDGSGKNLRVGRTLIHGDLKPANIFLRAAEDGSVSAALIDFQWTGWGLVGTDIAYLIATAAAAELLPLDGSGEALLLQRYHASLMRSLAKFGVTSEPEAIFPMQALVEQYEAGVVDLCRLALAYQWQRLKASPEVLQKNAKSLGRVAYNKSLHHVLWLVTRSSAIISSGTLPRAGKH